MTTKFKKTALTLAMILNQLGISTDNFNNEEQTILHSTLFLDLEREECYFSVYSAKVDEQKDVILEIAY